MAAITQQASRPQITPQQATELLRRSQADPVWWVETVLGEEPWELQRRIMESVRDNPRTGVKSCHSGGKSWLAARIAAWWLSCHRNSIVVTTAPSHRQVENVIWPEIRRARRAAAARGIHLPGNLPPVATVWRVADKWYAIGFSTDDPDRFQGLHSDYVLVIVDEASGIKPDIWEAIDAVMASGHVRLLTIGNPTDPTGPWAEEYRSLPANAKFTISAFDTPNFAHFGITQADIIDGTWEKKIGGRPIPRPYLITPQWVADKARRWGTNNPAWKARVLGEFPDSAPDALVPLAWIEAAQRVYEELKVAPLQTKSDDENVRKRAEMLVKLMDGPAELGVDVAAGGANKTTIYERRGIRLRRIFSGYEELTTGTVGRVKMALAETGAVLAKIDGIGVGAGVYGTLYEEGKPVVNVQSGRPSREPDRFANLRAEGYWRLRERFERAYEHGAHPDGIAIDKQDDDLAWELAAIKYKPTARGVLIESKDDMKARGVPSPDHADGAMLACLQVDTIPIVPLGEVQKESVWRF